MINDILLKILELREASVKELSETYGLATEVIKEHLLKYRDAVIIEGGRIVVKNPIGLADRLIRSGVSFKRVSRHLSWRDFEALSAKILAAHGYHVIRNLMMTKPIRLEIDVAGIDVGSGRGLFIDCKHWTRGIGSSALAEIALKQKIRVEKLLKNLSWIKPKYRMLSYLKKAYPIVITLTTPKIRVYEGVLILSIQELNRALIDLEMIIDTFKLEPIKP